MNTIYFVASMAILACGFTQFVTNMIAFADGQGLRLLWGSVMMFITLIGFLGLLKVYGIEPLL